MAKIFKCGHCPTQVIKINDKGCDPSCCGEAMTIIQTKTTDGALEKHVPVVKEEGDKVYVQVGSALHPMVEDHYIEWIYLLTDRGFQLKYLKPGQEPRAVFGLAEDEIVIEVSAYCNKHGLYKAELE